MSARLRGIARATEEAVAAGRYRDAAGQEVSIERAVTAALSGTRLYGPDPVHVAALDTDRVPRFEVTGESSLAAARRMAGERPAGSPSSTSPRPAIPAAATSTARRPRRKPCAGDQRSTRPCCAPPTTTRTTAPNAAPSTPTG